MAMSFPWFNAILSVHAASVDDDLERVGALEPRAGGFYLCS